MMQGNAFWVYRRFISTLVESKTSKRLNFEGVPLDPEHERYPPYLGTKSTDHKAR